MSTFICTFEDRGRARQMLDELLRGGVRPEDLSYIADGLRKGEEPVELSLTTGSVGDATSFVGRDDDPERRNPLEPPIDATEWTSAEMSRLNPIDTSDEATDVDSLDQMDDSQWESEQQIQPRHDISQSEHEKDDIALTVLSGFPTAPPTMDDLRDTETPSQDQLTDTLETVAIPGFGVICGSGPLATAALDFAQTDRVDPKPFMDYFRDEGIPEDQARDLWSAFDAGGTILTVTITPGEVKEEIVEQIADRLGAKNQGLFDAPRFYEGGGQATMR